MRIRDWSSDVCSSDLHRCRKVGIGLDHDDLAMAGLDRDGVGALIGQHQIDLVLANRTEVAEQHIFALRCVGIMDCLAGNFCNNTIGGHENLIDEAEVEFIDEPPKASTVEEILN